MPSLGSHMTRARMIAAELRHPAIDADRGSYYFGSTAPDIRVITRRDRSETHFFDLGKLDAQDSIETMLDAHSQLRAVGDLDPGTLAFMAGYLTHLAMDEVYIETMYREFFGAGSPMRDDTRAPVLDRALQYEMNRRDVEDEEAMREIRASLEVCRTVNAVPFIPDDQLPRWREVVIDFASQGPNWERFPRMMNVHLKRAGFSEEQIEDLSRNAPELVEESISYVGEARVQEFLDRAMERSLERVREYLP